MKNVKKNARDSWTTLTFYSVPEIVFGRAFRSYSARTPLDVCEKKIKRKNTFVEWRPGRDNHLTTVPVTERPCTTDDVRNDDEEW